MAAQAQKPVFQLKITPSIDLIKLELAAGG